MLSKVVKPFTPRSTKFLERGQFWGIPLVDGTFGAGCVVGLATQTNKLNSRVFIAGVVAWHGDCTPSVKDLSGRTVYAHAFAHIKAITYQGGCIIGCADIQFNSLPISAESLTLDTWGYRLPQILAAKFAAANI